jgi:hypothetical protein
MLKRWAMVNNYESNIGGVPDSNLSIFNCNGTI